MTRGGGGVRADTSRQTGHPYETEACHFPCSQVPCGNRSRTACAILPALALGSSNRVGVVLNTEQSLCARDGGVGKAPDHFIGSPLRPVKFWAVFGCMHLLCAKRPGIRTMNRPFPSGFVLTRATVPSSGHR